jgi:hypothetical protein
MMYSSDIPKTDDEIELEEIITQLDARLREVREGSAAHKMILRQLDGIRHGSELGGLLMEEYDAGSISHWG